jgi:hypothetical protein
MTDEQQNVPPDDRIARSTLVGVGCFSAIAGFFGGGMIAVMIAKIVGSARGCAPPPDLPACDWASYALVGMLVGVIGLPVVSVMRLKGRRV